MDARRCRPSLQVMPLPPQAVRLPTALFAVDRRRIEKEFVVREAQINSEMMDRGLYSSTARLAQLLVARVNTARELGEALSSAHLRAYEKSGIPTSAGDLGDIRGQVIEVCREKRDQAREKLLAELDRIHMNSRHQRDQLSAGVDRQFAELQMELHQRFGVMREEAKLNQGLNQPEVSLGMSEPPAVDDGPVLDEGSRAVASDLLRAHYLVPDVTEAAVRAVTDLLFAKGVLTGAPNGQLLLRRMDGVLVEASQVEGKALWRFLSDWIVKQPEFDTLGCFVRGTGASGSGSIGSTRSWQPVAVSDPISDEVETAGDKTPKPKRHSTPVVSARLRDDGRSIEVAESHAGSVLRMAEIRGAALVPMFELVARLSSRPDCREEIPWSEIEREWCARANWRGRLLKPRTLQDYGRRIARALTEKGLGHYWSQDGGRGVRWMGGPMSE